MITNVPRSHFEKIAPVGAIPTLNTVGGDSIVILAALIQTAQSRRSSFRLVVGMVVLELLEVTLAYTVVRNQETGESGVIKSIL